MALLVPLGVVDGAALHPGAPPHQVVPPYTITRLQDGDVFSVPGMNMSTVFSLINFFFLSYSWAIGLTPRELDLPVMIKLIK